MVPGSGGYSASPEIRIYKLRRDKTRAVLCQKLSELVAQRWQKSLTRNSGRLLLVPGGLSWCIHQDSAPH